MIHYSLIVDIVFLIVILVSIILCAKRGLFKTISGIAGTIIGFIGARMMGNSVGTVIEKLIHPILFKILSGVKVQMALSELGQKAIVGIEDIQSSLLESGLTEKTAEFISGVLDYMGASASQLAHMEADGSMAETLSNAAAEAMAPVIAFILLFVAIKVAVSLICSLFSVNLPIIREINKLGGALIGLASGLLTVVLICWGIVIFAPEQSVGFFSLQTLEHSVLGGFITDVFW